MIGRTLAHYEIVGKLGEGGMGAVFKAKDTHLDRFVALKVLPHDKMSDAERRRRFSQEAKAASALNHPNIITIYDISSSDGVDYIAMEFVEGKTLEALITAAPLKVSETLKYARHMADALAAAHSAGILHRDLKPANVMVKESGLVKVLDFGLAKLTDDGHDTSPNDTTRTMSSTRAGQILGTVAYMSPEQAEGKKVDFRSDIFSFGVVLYEMAAGTRAFPGDSQASVLAAVLRDDPKPVTETRSDMPWELDQLIARCLRKDPARRVQTMADLKASLEDIPENVTKSSLSTISAQSIPLPPPVPKPPPVFAAPPPPIPVYTVPAPMPPPPVFPSAPPMSAPEYPPRKRSRKGWWFLFALIFVVPSLLRQFRSAVRTDPPVSVAILKDLPLTGNSGIERMPSVSPNGQEVVYSWNGPAGDNFDIYRKPDGSGPSVRMTTNKAEDFAPAWSPDGETIAFLRRNGASDDILLIPSQGGEEKKVGEVSHQDNLYGLAWRTDNDHLIVSDASPGAQARLFELSVSSGKKTRITKPSENGGEYFPAVSPDGDTLAFVRDPLEFRAAVYTLDLTELDDDDNVPHKVVSLGMPISHPSFTADGRQLIFAAGAGGAWLLWRSNAKGSGKTQPVLGLDPGGEPAISLRGNRMVYSGNLKSAAHPLLLVENFR